ncbi:glycosyltransferase family protein [Planctomicrobium sp. SH661]|uniref:glycosyltransferase family protein n=1 Tax=Planctomicrobium sp. SH661 TaxID=3448124 RepID=UPI003F5C0FED
MQTLMGAVETTSAIPAELLGDRTIGRIREPARVPLAGRDPKCAWSLQAAGRAGIVRIIYGCNSQGQGHLSKAATLVPLLESRGHEVRVISSGPQPPAIYQFKWHRHLPGLPYVLMSGKTNYWQTVRNWACTLPGTLSSLMHLKRMVQEFEPQLIISDFEPMTASPLLSPGCEVVSMCRQVALLDPNVPLPPGESLQRRISGTVIRTFTMGATRFHGFHYSPDSHRCLPPVIREELLRFPVVQGKHLFIYNYHHTGRGEIERLMEWSKKRGVPVRAYGFPGEIARGLHGNVLMQPSDRYQMLADLASCRAAIVTSGLTTPLEAFLLQKPVVTVPLEDQWEQYTNAWHLELAGMAKMSTHWDYDAALELPAPTPDHPAWSWLTTSPHRILDAVLMEQTQSAPSFSGQFAA